MSIKRTKIKAFKGSIQFTAIFLNPIKQRFVLNTRECDICYGDAYDVNNKTNRYQAINGR
jgi:hypothetical protein